MKTILFIGGYGSKGGKAETLRQKKGWNVLSLLPDYNRGLTQWIEAAAKILDQNTVNEIHASSTGALVACRFSHPKVLYSPVIDPFRQLRKPLYSKKFLREAYVIELCSPCRIILPENDEVLFSEITHAFCSKNRIVPLISKNDDHRLTKYFGGLH